MRNLGAADGVVEHVFSSVFPPDRHFYPVFPPDRHAEQVLDWLRTRPPHAHS
ncbi:hypothetical protein ACQPYK_40070 [Streptosporangium sp. CA-135522]|uniref:hypothetical protein n=1 Tax=Streptosporangium sp. CA-135522 TaxID=3240072 RepID=UPI003D8FC170